MGKTTEVNPPQVTRALVKVTRLPILVEPTEAYIEAQQKLEDIIRGWKRLRH